MVSLISPGGLKRLALVAAFALAACSVGVGPRHVPLDRFDYNQAIAMSAHEQLLLNIVRLRYRDPINFLEVQSVLTSYNVDRGVSLASAIGLDSGPFDEALSGAASGLMSDTPTVTYAPLQGSDYAHRLLTPIPPETLVLLAHAGWSIERLMLCCVDRVGDVSNARSATGPMPSVIPDNREFRGIARALRAVQATDELTTDLMNGADGDDRTRVVLTFPQDDDRLREFEAMLARLSIAERAPADSSDGRPVFAVELTDTATRDGAALNGGTRPLLLRGRALLGVLYALSQLVETPDAHVADGVAYSPNTADPDAQWDVVMGGYFRVRTSPRRPDNAFVAVRYRSHWYYIDDTDHDTKATFDLVGHLFALQSAGADGGTPLLTVSAGR